MKKRTVLDEIAGRHRIKLEVFEDYSSTHDIGIPRQAWMRGIKLLERFGAERALDLIDQRAERAAERGDDGTARRWRDLIAAIHAIQENERLLGENLH